MPSANTSHGVQPKAEEQKWTLHSPSWQQMSWPCPAPTGRDVSPSHWRKEEEGNRYCVHFLWLLVTTYDKLGGWKHRNLYSHSSGGQKFKISIADTCWQGCALCRCSRGEPIPFLFQLQRLLAFLGLWPYYSSCQGQRLHISLCSVIMSLSPLHVCQISLCLSLIRTLVRAFKAIIIRSSDNPDHHPVPVKILHFITSAKSSPYKILVAVFRD